ncbi:MAG: helix-turn-helix transcriptional regulator [Bacteroidota bacterium]
MNLGRTIKTFRKRKGIRQGDLADACAITQSYLSNIEGNHREPTLSTLQSICRQLEIPLPILFFLSMDEADVKQDRRDLFTSISPVMKQTLEEAFT